MDTIISKVTIDCTDVTTITNPTHGLFAGIFKWSSGNESFSGSYKTGILVENGVGEINTSINLINGGEYASYDTVSISITNTENMWMFLASNGINLINKIVRIILNINGIDYPTYVGVIENITRTEVILRMEVNNPFKLFNEEIPNTVFSQKNVQNTDNIPISQEVKEGNLIPICVGRIANAKTLPVYGSSENIKLGDPSQLFEFSGSKIYTDSQADLGIIRLKHSSSSIITSFVSKTSNTITFSWGSSLEKDELSGRTLWASYNNGKVIGHKIESHNASTYPNQEEFLTNFNLTIKVQGSFSDSANINGAILYNFKYDKPTDTNIWEPYNSVLYNITLKSYRKVFKNEFSGLYLKVVKGPEQGKSYSINTNTESDSYGNFTIYTPDWPQSKVYFYPFINNSLPSIDKKDSEVLALRNILFKILKYNSTHIISEDPVKYFLNNAQGVYTQSFRSYNKDLNKFFSLSDSIKKISTRNISSTSKPGIEFNSTSFTSNGEVSRYTELPIIKIKDLSIGRATYTEQGSNIINTPGDVNNLLDKDISTFLGSVGTYEKDTYTDIPSSSAVSIFHKKLFVKIDPNVHRNIIYFHPAFNYSIGRIKKSVLYGVNLASEKIITLLDYSGTVISSHSFSLDNSFINTGLDIDEASLRYYIDEIPTNINYSGVRSNYDNIYKVTSNNIFGFNSFVRSTKYKDDYFKDFVSELNDSDIMKFVSGVVIDFKIKIYGNIRQGDTYKVRLHDLSLVIKTSSKVLNESCYCSVIGQVWNKPNSGKLYDDTPRTPSDIIYYLLYRYSNITAKPVSIDTTSFSSFNKKQSEISFGYQITEKKSVFSYIKMILTQGFMGMRLNGSGELTLFDITTTPDLEFAIDDSVRLKDGLSNIEKLPSDNIYTDILIEYGYNPANNKFEKHIGIKNLDKPSFPLEGECFGDYYSFNAKALNSVYFEYSTTLSARTLIKLFPAPGALVPGNINKSFSFSGSNYSSLLLDNLICVYEEVSDGYVTELWFNLLGNYLYYFNGISPGTVNGGVISRYDSIIPKWVEYCPGFISYTSAKATWELLKERYTKYSVLNALPENLTKCYWIQDEKSFDENIDNTTIESYLQKVISWCSIQKEMCTDRIPLNQNTVTLNVGSYVKIKDKFKTNDEFRHGVIVEKSLNLDLFSIDIKILLYDVQEFNYADGGLDTEVSLINYIDGGLNSEVSDIIDGKDKG